MRHTAPALLLAVLVMLVGCAPANTGKPSINYQSFLGNRNFKTVQADAISPYSDDVLIEASSAHEWMVKLNKPGKRLLLGVLSKGGTVDFLVNKTKLEGNTPDYADTSDNDAKQFDLKNPSVGTYYVYALNRTKNPQRYTLIVVLE